MAARDKEIWREISEPRLKGKFEVSNTGKVRNIITKYERSIYKSNDGHLCVVLNDVKNKITGRRLHRLVAAEFLGNLSNKKIIFKNGNIEDVCADNLELVNDKEDIEDEVWRDIEDEKYFGRYAVSNYGRVKQLIKTSKVEKGYILNRLHSHTGTPYVELVTSSGTITSIRIVDLVGEAFFPNFRKQAVKFKDGDKTNIHVSNMSYSGKRPLYKQVPKFKSIKGYWEITQFHHRGINPEYADFIIKELKKKVPNSKKKDAITVGAHFERLVDIISRFVNNITISAKYEDNTFYLIQDDKNLLKIFMKE